ncbi:MAG: hypothetical protein AAFV53_06665 [Myxococcota bacterium]
MTARFVALLLALFCNTAYAGYVWPVEVGISGSSAFGSKAAARDSADSTQYIGCAVFASGTTSTTLYGLCAARTATGTYLSCSTTNPKMIEAIQGQDTYGYLYFTETSGQCSYIYSNRFSSYLP